MAYMYESPLSFYLFISILILVSVQVLAFVENKSNRQLEFAVDSTEHDHEHPEKKFYDFYYINSAAASAANEECFNIDFEEGNLDGWTGQLGSIQQADGYPLIESIGFDPTQQMVTSLDEGFDSLAATCNIFIPRVGEGLHSLRLGDNDGGWEASWIRRPMLVTEENNLLLLSYAVVLENPDHNDWEQPRFSMKILDANNNVLPCGEYSVTAADGVEGFETCGDWEVRNWTTDPIILSPFMGQTIFIEFLAGDCSQGAHSGYAYMEAQCQSLDVLYSEFCPGTSITLEGPPNFYSYEWSTGDETSSITIDNPEPGEFYSLTLTSVNGCEAQLDFIVPDPGLLNSIDVESTEDVICDGDSVSLNVVGNNIASVYWNELGVYGPAQTVSPSETTTYTIYLEDVAECEPDTIEYTVEVREADTLSIPTDTTICIGNPLPLSAGYNGIYDLYWSPLDIYATELEIFPNQTTSYTVSSTDPTSCAPPPMSMTVTVLDPAPVSYQIEDQTICEGGTATLSISGENMGEIYWTDLDAMGPTVVLEPDAPAWYHFTIADQADCEVFEDSVFLDVIFLEPIEYNNDTLSVCPGESVTIEIIGDNVGNVYWYGTGETSNSITVSPGQTTNYEFQAYDLYGCSNVDDVITVEFTEQSSLFISSEISTICIGDELTMTAVYSGNADLVWEGLNFSESEITVMPQQNTTYTLSTNDQTACAPDPATFFVEVLNPAPLSFAIDDLSVCPGDPVTLQISGENMGEIIWTDLNQAGPTVTIAPAINATYHFTIADLADCQIFEDSVTVDIYEINDIEYNNDNLSVCPGETITLDISGDNVGNVYWYATGQNSNQIQVSPVQTTTYEFQVSDLSGCVQQNDEITVEYTEQSSLYITADQTIICIGNELELSANYSGNADLIWEGQNSSEAQILVSPTQTTTYTVSTNDQTSCAPDPTSFTVEVLNPAPLQYEISDLSLCPTEVGLLEITGQNLGDIFWEELNQAGNQIPYLPTESTWLHFTINDQLHCESFYDSVFVELNAQNILYIEQSDTAICEGQSLNLSVIYDGDETINWVGLDETGSSIAFAPQLSGWVVVEIIDSTLCAPPADSIFVTVHDADIVYNADSLFFCLGDALNLEIEGSNIETVYWQSLDSYDNPIATYPTENTLYPFVISDANNCTEIYDTIVAVLTDQFELNIEQNPITICIGEEISLTAFYDGSADLFWPELNLYGDSVSFEPQESQTYQVVSLDESNCAADPDFIFIEVLNFPAVSYQLNDIEICLGTEIVLAPNPENFTQIYWPQFDSNEEIITFSPDSSGYFYFEIEGLGDCQLVTDSVYVTVNPADQLEVSQFDTTICIGNSIPIEIFYNGDAPLLWNGEILANNSFEIIPLDTTVYTVSVMDETTCAPEPIEFTITVLDPPPMVIEIDDQQIICLGDSANLTVLGENFGEVYWPSLDTTTSKVTVAPDTTTVYVFYVSDLYNCEMVVDSFTVLVDIVFPPLVSPERGDTLICDGDTAFLSISGSNVETVYWPDLDIYVPELAVTPSESTVYRFVVWDSLGCQIVEDSVFVNVNPLPEISFEQEDPDVCIHDTIVLSVLGENIDTFHWLIQDAFGPTIELAPDSTQTLFVQGTDVYGCRSLETPITVFVLVPPEMEYEIEDKTVCFNDTVQLEVAGDFIGAAYWSDFEQDGFAVETVASQDTSYEILVSDVFGCDTVLEKVMVEVLPLPEVMVDDYEITVCEEERILLEVENEEYSEIYWFELNEYGPQVELLASDSVEINVQVTDLNLCRSVVSPIQVNVNPLPQINILQNDFVICLGETLEIEIESFNTELGMVNWNGLVNEENVFTSTPSVSQNFEIEAWDIYGCSSKKQDIPIEVLTAPLIELGPDLCESPGVELDASFPGAEYQWQDGNDESIFSVEQSGLYTVEVANQCGVFMDSVWVYIDGCQFKFATVFSPNGDGLHDRFGPIDYCINNRVKNIKFRIFNRWGNKIYESSQLDQTWDGRFRGKEVGTGVYVWFLEYYSEVCDQWFFKKGNVSLIK